VNIQSVIEALGSHKRARRSLVAFGTLFIAVVMAIAGYEIYRGYDAAIENTGRELDTQARIMAEQTARSIQAIDVLLRYLAAQEQRGAFDGMSEKDLYTYLKEQAVGLAQINGLHLADAKGITRGAWVYPTPGSVRDVSDRAFYTVPRDNPGINLFVGQAIQSRIDGEWLFPVTRRLEHPDGSFAGTISARARVEYFRKFYQDVQLEPGTKVTLMHRDGTLIARNPQIEAGIGKRYPIFDEMLALYTSPGHVGPTRVTSPLDGIERFGAIELVPDYPLAVVVTRDTRTALAPWREQSFSTARRTLALSALAALMLAVAMRQLSRLQAARESLAKSEERFALAVAGSNDGIIDWDIATGRIYSSKRAMEIVGIDSDVTERSREEWVKLIRYQDRERARDDLVRFLASRDTLRDVEYQIAMADGSLRWIRHRHICVRDADGKALRLVGSVSDTTDYRNAESERVRLENQLLQAKKLEAIGTLAGGIAHDFNNILSAILGYGEMAQKDSKEGTPLRRHIDAAMSAGVRAKSLVERILAFSRSGIGERTPVHVQSVVAEALDLVAASLPKDVRLERALAAGDAAVLGDPTQIHQVVMNLCTNAVQAMKAGGTLTVSLDVVEKSGGRVATSVLAGGRYLRLSVRDTGPGIPAKILERIFDPFFTTKEVGVGTGLGLSLVHGIVTDLGGGIDVESRPGEGAIFTVYLPWSSAVAAPAGVAEVATPGTGETILLVDDEEPLVRLGEEMIAGLGYEPVGFTSSAQALQSFRASPSRFHAVLSDEAMPEMTGSELAREIRLIRPDIPIVLMSGFVSPALLGRARELGVMEVLAKPLVERDIARGLANALRNGVRS